MQNVQRYLITGILTVIPVWITWLVFRLVFEQLIHIGKPGVLTLANALQGYAPSLSKLLLEPWVFPVIALFLTLLALYLLGWATSKVIGRDASWDCSTDCCNVSRWYKPSTVRCAN